MSPRGRYAPSPTGALHVGNASTALLAWLSVRSRRGTFVMRMEDLDLPRVRPGAADAILEDLAWLGLDWDEGDDVGGPYPPYRQSERFDRYRAAFEGLRDAGRVYPCFCSRKDIAAAASAPQDPGDEVRYPGTCRGADPHAADRRIEAAERHAWRFRVDRPHAPAFHDVGHGEQGGEGAPPPGDFVVWRSDGTASYQLAVVVDDAAMAIDEVVRGDDLLSSTGRQLELYDAFGLTVPRFTHVPLILGPDGVRLSKRHAGTTVRELRDAGHEPAAIVGRMAELVGLQPDATPRAPRDLVDGFRWDAIPRADGGIHLHRI